ncbi:hypothetical protein KY358_06645 [Candidatus Woesearchaeota archaeon]|nr:hypothetical protein [Candidatus Woesearchaeota archaeon]
MKFFEYIKKTLLHSNDNKAKGLYSKCYDHHNFAMIINERIKNDCNKLENSAKEIFGSIKKNRKPPIKSAKDSIDALESLKLDLESFFIFVRALMDDICKIIKFLVGNIENKLPDSMNKLLRGDFEGFNKYFHRGLKSELSWLDEFRDKRDKLLHKLHDIVIIGDSRGLSFDIGTPGDKMGTQEATKNIKDFTEDIISKIDHLENTFLTSNIKKINGEENLKKTPQNPL